MHKTYFRLLSEYLIIFYQVLCNSSQSSLISLSWKITNYQYTFFPYTLSYTSLQFNISLDFLYPRGYDSLGQNRFPDQYFSKSLASNTLSSPFAACSPNFCCLFLDEVSTWQGNTFSRWLRGTVILSCNDEWFSNCKFLQILIHHVFDTL